MTSTLQDATAPEADAYFSLALLDFAQGHAVETWKFDGTSAVTIGRLEDNDVVLSDPLVSRLHATIKQVDGGWELIALGKHGVLVGDRRVDAIELSHELVFQLGPKGPQLQFLHPARMASVASQINQSTMEIDPAILSLLLIDEEQAAAEVSEIVENEGFHQLLERARKLRDQRSY